MNIYKDIEKIYASLPDDQKKILEDYDLRIKRAMDKTPKDFFEARKKGGEFYDVDILQHLKIIAFARMTNDPLNNIHVLTEVSNKLCRLYEQWLDVEIRLNEMKKKQS